MSLPVLIKDGFLPNPEEALSFARSLEYRDVKGPDGELYKGVAPLPNETFVDLISAAIGFPVKQSYAFARLSLAGENPNNAIHSDSGYDEFATVLYLTPDEFCQGGTAFWKHKVLKFDELPDENTCRRIGRSPKAVIDRLSKDWNDESKWDLRGVVDMKFNRAVFFRCKQFHSRYPFQAFGAGPQDGRLTFISFFSRA